MLLDLSLPDGDGRDVCRELRRARDVPIIMLTARGTETDRIVGLELGADDYVVKPFSGPEVIARIRAVLRRAGAQRRRRARAVRVRRARRSIPRRGASSLDGAELELSRKEFDLLAALVARRRARRHARGPDGRGVGRELVRLDARRSTSTSAGCAASSATTRRAPRFIHTVRGVGFRFAAPEELEP